MSKETLQHTMRSKVRVFEDGGIRLLRKGQKGLIHAIFSRFGLVLVLLVLQFGALFSLMRWFSNLLPHYLGGTLLVTAAMMVYLLNQDMNNSVRIPWLVVTALAPVLGVLLFCYTKEDVGHRMLKKRLLELEGQTRARHSVHIITPYLILDGELETALRFAAERGVDVHLILPGKPDKVFVYALAKTHYLPLLSSGVKISEWTPGFTHAKVMIMDGQEAVVGTINLDYRSLYHHFENAVWMRGVDCLPRIEADFQDTLAQCRTVEPTRQSIWQGKKLLHLVGIVLKFIAPLI